MLLRQAELWLCQPVDRKQGKVAPGFALYSQSTFLLTTWILYIYHARELLRNFIQDDVQKVSSILMRRSDSVEPQRSFEK